MAYSKCEINVCGMRRIFPKYLVPSIHPASMIRLCNIASNSILLYRPVSVDICIILQYCILQSISTSTISAGDGTTVVFIHGTTPKMIPGVLIQSASTIIYEYIYERILRPPSYKAFTQILLRVHRICSER